MVKIRLRKMGANDKPFYRIVAVDARQKRDGGYLDNIGYYDPKTDPFTLKVDTEKALKWLNDGAQATETVKTLLRRAGILEIWHKEKLAGKPVQEPAASAE